MRKEKADLKQGFYDACLDDIHKDMQTVARKFPEIKNNSTKANTLQLQSEHKAASASAK